MPILSLGLNNAPTTQKCKDNSVWHVSERPFNKLLILGKKRDGIPLKK